MVSRMRTSAALVFPSTALSFAWTDGGNTLVAAPELRGH